jgi:hypothetical protein
VAGTSAHHAGEPCLSAARGAVPGGPGHRQFIDIGSGIPTVGNVHEVAQQADPSVNVVYVDIDPVAVTHSRLILADDDRTLVVQEDLRNPEELLGNPDLLAHIDLDEPVAVLMVAVLHFIGDEDRPPEIIARYRSRIAPGSHLVISHASYEGQPELAKSHQELYQQTRTPMTMRSRAEIKAFFEGFTLVDPGVVWLPLWRPEASESRSASSARMGTSSGQISLCR